MTKKQFYILLSILLVAVLIFSNPSEDVHIQSVKSKLKTAFKKKMSSEIIKNQSDTFSSLGNGLGLLLGNNFIDKLADGLVNRKNFYLFSLTNVDYKGEEKIIGFGLLGNVFLSDKIEKIFQQNKNNEKASEITTNDERFNPEISDEEYKKRIPTNNLNSKYEFTADMLLDRNYHYFKNYVDENDDNKGEYCFGIITKYTNKTNNLNDYKYAELTIKLSKSNNYLLHNEFNKFDVGDEIELSLDAEAIEYTGKSKMCEECAQDFKELMKVGRKIKFKAVVTTGPGSSGGGEIWGLTYININE
jgi:hypothetical protein